MCGSLVSLTNNLIVKWFLNSLTPASFSLYLWTRKSYLESWKYKIHFLVNRKIWYLIWLHSFLVILFTFSRIACGFPFIIYFMGQHITRTLMQWSLRANIYIIWIKFMQNSSRTCWYFVSIFRTLLKLAAEKSLNRFVYFQEFFLIIEFFFFSTHSFKGIALELIVLNCTELILNTIIIYFQREFISLFCCCCCCCWYSQNSFNFLNFANDFFYFLPF